MGKHEERHYLRQYAGAIARRSVLYRRYPYKMVLNFENCVITKARKLNPQRFKQECLDAWT
jgi:hypothetical protein